MSAYKGADVVGRTLATATAHCRDLFSRFRLRAELRFHVKSPLNDTIGWQIECPRTHSLDRICHAGLPYEPLAPTSAVGYSGRSHRHPAHSACGQGGGGPHTCQRCPAASARSHRHPCVTTWADGQSGRTLSGEDRCVHSLTQRSLVLIFDGAIFFG